VVGIDRPPAPSLGSDLANSVVTLEVATWPALWPALASCLGMLALLLLGTSLVNYGWYRAATVMTADLDVDDTANFSVSGHPGRPHPTRPEWLPPADDDRTIDAGWRPYDPDPDSTQPAPIYGAPAPGRQPGFDNRPDNTDPLPVQQPPPGPPNRSSWQ
jgi:hypothetical protein